MSRVPFLGGFEVVVTSMRMQEPPVEVGLTKVLVLIEGIGGIRGSGNTGKGRKPRLIWRGKQVGKW